ncbi:MAG: response regulator transcription factor [Nitrospirae bacterium]|nr:MAG: response regulator transcription factor [Nitrospirota bacterium]
MKGDTAKQFKVLVVEDEEKISDIVRLYLEREGYSAKIAGSGAAALKLLKDKYDLVILDLMLPDMDGEAVCSAIREFSDIPIIMLTAKSSEDDRVAGLGLGADDYVIKPFSPRELVARVKAQLRRSRPSDKKIISSNNGSLIIDTDSMEVLKDGRVVPLTSTEFRIVLHMAERPQMVFSRAQLVNLVQGYDFEGYDRVIDAHIKNIRQKIEDDPHRPSFIKTVHGAGYKFIGGIDG